MIYSYIVLGEFYLIVDNNKQLLTYQLPNGMCGSIWPNEQDKRHADNLNVTPFEHKLIHELTHFYVAKAFNYGCCPIVKSQVCDECMPENADYLEEIIISLVYFSLEKQMLYDTWFGYLDRLHGRSNVYQMKRDILNSFNKRNYNKGSNIFL